MRKRILFVDDENDWRLMVSSFFKVSGYDIVTAKDATEALSQTGGLQLDVIILDMNLAGEDGLVLMKYLKKNYPEVPIILYTAGEHDEQAIQALLKQGAHQYLRKGNLGELL